MASAFSLNTSGSFSILAIAVISALLYYLLRSFTPNKFIILAIGIIMMLFLNGTLQTVGMGITALGVSRLVSQDLGTLMSS